jgi:uncharacterized protein YggT (Ycf19 family)
MTATIWWLFFLQKKIKKFFFIFITYSFSKAIQKFDDFIKEG